MLTNWILCLVFIQVTQHYAPKSESLDFYAELIDSTLPDTGETLDMYKMLGISEFFLWVSFPENGSQLDECQKAYNEFIDSLVNYRKSGLRYKEDLLISVLPALYRRVHKKCRDKCRVCTCIAAFNLRQIEHLVHLRVPSEKALEKLESEYNGIMSSICRGTVSMVKGKKSVAREVFMHNYELIKALPYISYIVDIKTKEGCERLSVDRSVSAVADRLTVDKAELPFVLMIWGFYIEYAKTVLFCSELKNVPMGSKPSYTAKRLEMLNSLLQNIFRDNEHLRVKIHYFNSRLIKMLRDVDRGISYEGALSPVTDTLSEKSSARAIFLPAPQHRSKVYGKQK